MPDSIFTQIKELDSKGFSVKAISNQLHTGGNTILRYLPNHQFSNRALGYIKSQERKRKRFMELDKLKVSKITKKDAQLYAALLYWCEGSKYPASNALGFTTSDAKMQRFFINLLRKGFRPAEEKFRVKLQIHSDHNKNKIYTYWSSILRVPTRQFIKPTVTQKTGRRYRRVYYGTCTLKYNDYSLILRLMGIYQRFYKQALASLI